MIGSGNIGGAPRNISEFAGYPSLAQIAGHAMSSIFLDGLSLDIERLNRINATLSLLTPSQRSQTNLRPIEMLAITPSQPLELIASRHVGSLPLPFAHYSRLLVRPNDGAQRWRRICCLNPAIHEP